MVVVVLGDHGQSVFDGSGHPSVCRPPPDKYELTRGELTARARGERWGHRSMIRNDPTSQGSSQAFPQSAVSEPEPWEDHVSTAIPLSVGHSRAPNVTSSFARVATCP